MRQSQLINASPPTGHQTTVTYGGGWAQVSRLGMPLVNEVVIGLVVSRRLRVQSAR